MSGFEVDQPILNRPYDEPRAHWLIREGFAPEKLDGRRPALVYPPQDGQGWDVAQGHLAASALYRPGLELVLVNRVRQQVERWRMQDYPGATRTTRELLQWWAREGRKTPLFFAQLEAARTIIFLREARADFLQGIDVPVDEPTEQQQAAGAKAFTRYACKMATGSGKTTVMGMIAAWSILNKVNDRSDARFSDVVLIVCPNVTIRNRLSELDPELGDASLYRTRDLVPEHLMPSLRRGRVLVTNWHVFEPQAVQVAGTSAKVVKAGLAVRTRETIHIGAKSTTARGSRYLTEDDFRRQVDADILTVIEEIRKDGRLVKAQVDAVRYVESDASLLQRVLGREVGGKQNILVINDEAHHAYRIRAAEAEDGDDDDEPEDDARQATVWIDGLDRIHRRRTINFAIDLSATPFFLSSAGRDAGRPFPWIVSDFGLVDAIESGLTKIPQLALQDTSGADRASYFNIWRWIMEKLTAGERGGRRSDPSPLAVLKYAHHPIAILGGQWEEDLKRAVKTSERPPVFIIVCKNTKIARFMFEWLAEGKTWDQVPRSQLAAFKNTDKTPDNTLRVDTKVVHETDSGDAKSDSVRWMRHQLDTIGRSDWPADRAGRPIYPEGFEELAKKLGKPLHPPGRDVRCVISVGMLTEGWDCNTVRYIVGVRPFMSQLLCEQVVGRGLRRSNYQTNDDGMLAEEVAQVLGVPFEVIPFKANPKGVPPPKPKQVQIRALPERQRFRIRFPRVEGYTCAIRNRITVDWKTVPALVLRPDHIPPEVSMARLQINTKGRPVLGAGPVGQADLDAFRTAHRVQELVFDLAAVLTAEYSRLKTCEAPPHVLFPQVVSIVRRYLDDKVEVPSPANLKDVFLAPYYGWVIEKLRDAIRPDTSQGEAPELPRYEKGRGPGTTDEVEFWTSREVRESTKCHVNFVVADTKRWEQSAAYRIDRHPKTAAFVKNAGLGFSIPYFANGQPHDYLPDFIVRLKCDAEHYRIIETKGYDPLAKDKAAAAERWTAAVNAEGTHGQWRYSMVAKPEAIDAVLAAD